MFVSFFYQLRNAGIPISPTSFLKLQKALYTNLIQSVEDFYIAARTILIKSERHFDLYDRIFAHYFEGVEFIDVADSQLEEIARGLLEEWLNDPKIIANALGIDENTINKLTPDELIEYFKKRLQEQKERHDGGNKWIGTGGTSPVGHSGYHPGGMRVGGQSRNKSAIKVAMERRYKDYSAQGVLSEPLIGEALKRLRNMSPSGSLDQVNIEKSIYQTIKNFGEIEIIFNKRLKDRLKIILMIDNGGWSMDPYVQVIQTIFNYARSQFKDLKVYFFHNTIYDCVWEDVSRYKKPQKVNDFIRFDPQTRLIIVGDASMAPYELMVRDGSIYINDRSGQPSIEQLKFLSTTFKYNVWLNPVSQNMWNYTHTISTIRNIFPMFELSLDGIEKAVNRLKDLQP
ncbi:MAG: hypothetical protein HQK77_13635 [Desulfobacterales bacterium]|nr:hypothetical protein [Desulfobacterales bacterium]